MRLFGDLPYIMYFSLFPFFFLLWTSQTTTRGGADSYHVITVICLCSIFSSVVQSVDPVLFSLTQYVSEGAVCLDGSTAGYYYRPGVGSGKIFTWLMTCIIDQGWRHIILGATNWILHMEGGGWCTSLETCFQRISTPLGSSKQWPPTLNASIVFQSSLYLFLFPFLFIINKHINKHHLEDFYQMTLLKTPTSTLGIYLNLFIYFIY